MNFSAIILALTLSSLSFADQVDFVTERQVVDVKFAKLVAESISKIDWENNSIYVVKNPKVLLVDSNGIVVEEKYLHNLSPGLTGEVICKKFDLGDFSDSSSVEKMVEDIMVLTDRSLSYYSSAGDTGFAYDKVTCIHKN